MEPLKILNSEIPAGGRRLTSAELRAIRETGRSISNSAIVRQNRAAHLGIVYTPLNGGYMEF